MRIDDFASGTDFSETSAACVAQAERVRPNRDGQSPVGQSPAVQSPVGQSKAGRLESEHGCHRSDPSCGATTCCGSAAGLVQASSSERSLAVDGAPCEGEALIADSLAAKRKASSLLQSLQEQRALLEARLSDAGRCDPIRAVSGRSAIERAIASTRAMIAAADDLLLRQLLLKNPSG